MYQKLTANASAIAVTSEEVGDVFIEDFLGVLDFA